MTANKEKHSDANSTPWTMGRAAGTSADLKSTCTFEFFQGAACLHAWLMRAHGSKVRYRLQKRSVSADLDLVW